MKQKIILSFLMLSSVFSHNIFAVTGTLVCKHGGYIYAYANNNVCPNYTGDDIQTKRGWYHTHGGNNQYSRNENISDNSDPSKPIGTIISENTDHCTVTKTLSNSKVY